MLSVQKHDFLYFPIFLVLYIVRQALDGINIYDILEPCYHSPDADKLNSKSANSSLPLSFQQLGMTKKPLPVRKRMFGRAWPFEAPVRDGLVPLWPQLAAAGARIHVPCFVSFSFF